MTSPLNQEALFELEDLFLAVAHNRLEPHHRDLASYWFPRFRKALRDCEGGNHARQ